MPRKKGAARRAAPRTRLPKGVSHERLRWRCPAGYFAVRTSAEIPPADRIVGQDKAVQALRLGVELYSPGYNIFVCGLSGTGKMTTVKAMLESIKPPCPLPPDRCYVNNFKNPHRPILITLPRGQGVKFRRDMELVVEFLRKHVPLELDSELFQKKREQISRDFEEKGKAMFLQFDGRARAEGFTIAQVQSGMVSRPDLLPVVDGKPQTIQDYERHAREQGGNEEELNRRLERYAALREELDSILRESQRLSREMMARMAELARSTIRRLVGPLAEEIREKYPDEKIAAYLGNLVDDVVENIGRFLEGSEDGAPAGLPPGLRPPPQESLLPYRVNVVLDNSDRRTSPVVIETSPTFNNLFGYVEKVPEGSGQFSTDFTRIKAGSLLLADGGYLVFNAADALTEPGVWKALKRTLTYNLLEIQGIDSVFGVVSSPLKPDPIALSVKVIVIGDSQLFDLLYRLDEDFKQIFKVKVDFDASMTLDRRGAREFAAVVSKVCRDEGLRPLTREALAALVEHGVRLSGMREKLSTRFSEVADLVREADFWSRGDEVTGRAHLERAIAEQEQRNNLWEEKVQEYIDRGTLMIDTRGAVVGQVNGLSITDLGNHRFGRPTRITASTSCGRSGIINIEREAKLSGRTHDKGVLILGGCLRQRYAQEEPLALSASVCFEQSYSGVDGDSASSTELYAILSSLSGLPLRQGIAVTGSINQRGEIQPIGGVNEKIEGFFDVCRSQGITREQGVIIPRLNLQDLMLRQDVVDSVKKGRFHVWAVETVDQGMEILTGLPAGRRRRGGEYPPGTVNRLVMDRLSDLSHASEEAPPPPANTAAQNGNRGKG